MNKGLKLLATLGVIVPTAVMCTACDINQEKYVVSIYESATTDSTTTYTIEYSDGSKSNFSVTNGKDGSDLTLEDIWNSAKEKGYTGDYWQFVEDYLSITINSTDMTVATNKAMLSAVSIYAEFPVTKIENTYNSNGFGGFYITGQKEVKTLTVGAGSGIIYQYDTESGDAYIITNYHVVYNTSCDTDNKIANKISLYLYGSEDDVYYELDSNGNYVYGEDGYPIFNNGESAIECEFVGGSMAYDIAVLKVSASDILKNSDAKAVEVAESYSTGENVVAIGNPEAEGISVTKGIVSVDSEYITMTSLDSTGYVTYRVMRVDTAINSGNSGGGLFNESGELVGIVNAKTTDTSVDNIGYAIPYTVALGVADNVISNYETDGTKALVVFDDGLYVSGKNSKGVLNENTGLVEIVEDVCVTQIVEGSILSESGLQVDDIITSIVIGDVSYDITRVFELVDTTFSVRKGDAIELHVLRDGNVHVFTYTADASYFTTIA